MQIVGEYSDKINPRDYRSCFRVTASPRVATQCRNSVYGAAR